MILIEETFNFGKGVTVKSFCSRAKNILKTTKNYTISTLDIP